MSALFRKIISFFVLLFAHQAHAVPVTPAVIPHITFVNQFGGPCAGCKLYSYSAGTTTPLATYTDATGTSTNTNPITLDVAGGTNIWLGGSSYKFILKDSLGATIWTVDQVTSIQALINTACPISSGCVITAPTGTQTVTQPASTTLKVNSFNWIVYASDYSSLSNAAAACPASGNCQLEVTQPLNVTASITLASTIALKFTNGGALNISSGQTITVSSGIVEAPSVQIVTGSGTMAGLSIARPEWFGPNSTSAGFLAAYSAVIPNGLIPLQATNYISPFTTGVGVAKKVQIIGQQRPQLDSETAPTLLQNGTVIKGLFLASQGFTLKNVGIDAGSAYSAGTCTYGLFLARDHSQPAGYIYGVDWENIAVLTCGVHSDGGHGMLLENTYGAFVKDFYMTTTGADYGVINKGVYGYFENIHTKGATQSCFLTKSDYASASDGNSQHNVYNGVWCEYLATVGDTLGPWIDGRGDVVTGEFWNNVHLNGLGLGFRLDSAAGYGVNKWKVANLTGINMQNACIYANSGFPVDTVDGVNISCEINNASMGNFGITTGTNTTNFSLSNVTISSSASSTFTGFFDQSNSGSVKIDGINCFGFTGACVGSTNSQSTPTIASNITATSPTTASSGQIYDQHNNPIDLNADLYWRGTHWHCYTQPCTMFDVRDQFNNVQGSWDDTGHFFSAFIRAGNLTSGNCVQASTGGLLTTTGGPCSGGSAFITSLTTTGSSGAATVSSGVLNIPVYSGGGAVSSVFGRTGAVVAATNDYSFSQISGTAAAAQLPVATTSAFGAVKPDGTTVTISSGVISAVTGGSGTVTHTAGALTSGDCVIGNGTADIKVDPNCSTDGAGNVTAVSYTASGTTPGAVGLSAGTGSIPALAANSAGFAAPVTGGTAYRYKLPATAVAGILHVATPATADGVLESALTASAVNLASADVTGLLPHANIAATAVTPGSYTSANITVAADGSITAAANGSGGGGGPSFVTPRDPQWSAVNINTGHSRLDEVGFYLVTDASSNAASTAYATDANLQQYLGIVTSTATSNNSIQSGTGSVVVTGKLPSSRIEFGLSTVTNANAWVINYGGYVTQNDIQSDIDYATTLSVATVGFRFYPGVNSHWVAYFGDGVHTSQTVTTTVSPTANVLQTFDMFWGSTSLTYYIDGVLVATITPSNAFSSASLKQGTIFQNISSTAATGLIGPRYYGQQF